jgi:hypothetical protein
MADADAAAEARRRAFQARAPELRAALVAELAACLERAASLTPDEAAVLRHLLVHAGYSERGLYLADYAALWGETPSWVPAVPLAPERARTAADALVRRGVLRGLPGLTGPREGGVLVDDAAVRALAPERASAAAPRRGRRAASRARARAAVSLDGFLARKDGSADWPAPPPLEPAPGLEALTFPGGELTAARFRDKLHLLLKKDRVDALELVVRPVLLGDGVPLFKRGRPPLSLRPASARVQPDGAVLLRYERA